MPVNILFNNTSPNAINGIYYINKDNKIKIEVKEIEKQFQINIDIKMLSDFNSAKCFAELINKILVTENGFMRNYKDIFVNDKKEETIIKLKG